ncbi:hypothetical protein SEA_MAGRITTE_169 [Microbacterium phage Magritte]|nr:hypothetical protein SEA_MAGRITTE_169 [Microbacterium phage Magritte]
MAMPRRAVEDRVHYRGVPHMTGTITKAEYLPMTYGLYAVRWDDEPHREAAWYSYFDLEPVCAATSTDRE